MTMLQVHAEALESSSAAYHEFLLRYKEGERTVYGFIEGKDDPTFYRSMIERNLPEDWEVVLIRSGNKENVLKILAFIDWSRFSSKRISFFVDRDLSEFIGGQSDIPENLYVTDNYSIENDIATSGTLMRVLEEILNITNLSPAEADRIKKLFESNLLFFQEAMTPVMSQILLWKRNGGKPSLNDIPPKSFFGFSDGTIALKPAFSTVLSRIQHAASCVNAHRSADADLVKAEAEFRSKRGVEKFIRGKYILWFFVKSALEFHRVVSIFSSKYHAPPKVRITLGYGNAMVVIAPRARCPASLQLFIEHNYSKYISEVCATE